MTGNAHKRVGLAATLALLASTSDAFAGLPIGVGGTIVYAPPAESIPALSDAMLVVLGMLLAVVAFRVLRNYPGGRPLASIVALSIAGLSAVSGIKVMQEAYAAPPSYSMDAPNGGSIYIGITGSDVSVDNNTGRTQQIKSVTPDPFCFVVTPSSSPACAPGVIVQPTNACYVRFGCSPV